MFKFVFLYQENRQNLVSNMQINSVVYSIIESKTLFFRDYLMKEISGIKKETQLFYGGYGF